MSDFRDTHPADLKPHQKLWFGSEVEGCLKGTRTAFIADVLDYDDMQRLKQEEPNIAQLFFTETFDAWEWILSSFIMREILARRTYYSITVTVGRMDYQAADFIALRGREPRLTRFNMIVRLFGNDWAMNLERNDQISVGQPYRMVTFDYQDGVKTEPREYVEDK